MRKDFVHSKYTSEAVALLGKVIRMKRIERRMTAADLAERCRISRMMLYRIERGDLRCHIGAVFEAAKIVGVPLFNETEVFGIRGRRREVEDRLTLLPKHAHGPREVIDDHF